MSAKDEAAAWSETIQAFAKKRLHGLQTVYLGDPSKISKVKVRFSRPVMIDDTVTFTGKVTAIEGGKVSFDVAAKNQKGEDVLKGTVVEARV